MLFLDMSVHHLPVTESCKGRDHILDDVPTTRGLFLQAHCRKKEGTQMRDKWYGDEEEGQKTHIDCAVKKSDSYEFMDSGLSFSRIKLSHILAIMR